MRYKAFCVSLLVLYSFSSCGTRKVSASKERVKILEQSSWARTAPGDRVYITAPRPDPPRPAPGDSSKLHQREFPGHLKRTTLRKDGPNGGLLTVRLAGTHFVDAECECPPIQEQGQSHVDALQVSKQKESERKSAPWGWFTAIALAGFSAGAYFGRRWF